MMLTLFILLGAMAGLAALVLCAAAAHDPPPLPSRPVGTDLPPCLERWLELEDPDSYDHRRFDAQIEAMIVSTARWQERRAS